LVLYSKDFSGIQGKQSFITVGALLDVSFSTACCLLTFQGMIYILQAWSWATCKSENTKKDSHRKKNLLK
jgi:hypothetical protein